MTVPTVTLVVDRRPWSRVGGTAIRNEMLIEALRSVADLELIEVTERDRDQALGELASALAKVRSRVRVFSGRDMADLAVAVPRIPGDVVVYDAHNVESCLIQALHEAALEEGDWGLIERYSARRVQGVREIEQEMIARSAQVWAVSDDDRSVFCGLGAPDVRAVPNVINPADYDAAAAFDPEGRSLLFVGRLDYLPNMRAVRRLCHEVMPALRRRGSASELVVAGANPAATVVEACGRAGVTLVADPDRATLHGVLSRSIVVLPMTEGGGSRTKILEAFAYGAPVVASGQAMAGIDARPGVHYLKAHDSNEFVTCLDDMIRTGFDLRLAREANALVRRCYSIDVMRQRVALALADLAAPDRAS